MINKIPLWNEDLPLEDRLDYLIKELTLEEKLQCLTVRAPEVKRLGIRPFSIGGEAAHGVEARHDQSFNQGTPVKTTVFTQPIGMSATWDTELIEKAGIVTGTEARAIYQTEGNIGLSRWGPTIDMERDPRWGRTEEGYGEDPYLTGKMASAYIKGIQGRDNFYLRCAATLKHFYANNEEKDREFSSSSLDCRNKQEYYLEPFRRAITEGNAEAVMTSYNEINGIPAIVNNEVKDLVKDKWGLKGHVVCDMGDMGHTVTKHKYVQTDAETLAQGLKAGIDSFNDPENIVIEAAGEALRRGLITEEDINRAVRNTFSTKLRLGIYDSGNKCPYSDITADCINAPKHQEVCLEVAKKALVLLKNENRLLPLNRNTKETIAVVGPLSDEWNKDWYSGIPKKPVTPLMGLRQELPLAHMISADGSDRVRIRTGQRYLAVKDDGTCYLAEKADAALFEHTDWGDNKHTLRCVRLKKFLNADTEKGCVLANRTEIFSWFVQEAFSFYKTNQKADGASETFRVKSRRGEARSPRFVWKSWDQKLIYINNEGNLSIGGSAGTVFTFEVVAEGLKQAEEAAKAADKVIAVMGCHPILHAKEASDRRNINLPPVQRILLQRLIQVNPNIILVLITNYPYAITWEKAKLPAILITASGSQALGTAIAKAVSGEYSPSGRLNMTWYQSNGQLPPMRDYDIIHTKRTYQYFKGKVLYPFGYGLTYTSFRYRRLILQECTGRLNISLQVKNSGTYDSDEVVQLYVSQLYSRTIRPIRQLKGFQRIFLKAGEEKEIQFCLPYEELKYYDTVSASMVLEDSDYVIQTGPSSQNIRLREKLHIKGTVIGARDSSRIILCDHYDSYDNLYLHRGHDGKPCMLPAQQEQDNGLPVRGIAEYRDFCFHKTPEHFIVDVKAEEPGKMIVRYGRIKLAEIEMMAMQKFDMIRIPVINTGIEINKRKTLRIELRGKIKVVSFSFQ